MLKANTIIVRTPFYPFVQKGVTETFQQQVQSATFKEALFLGSPNLYEEFAKAGSSLNEATKLSLYKYFLRMSYRCTPFGMFSGVSAGVVSECTSFKLAPQQTYLKHTRPDNHFINVFIHKALVDESLKQSVSWYSNNTAYQTGNSIRYVEYRLHNYQRTHHLAKVESSPYLNSILQRAKTGATIHELTLALISLEIPEDEARAFIDELIDSRLILSELEPVVTGQEPYLMVLAILEKYESGKPYATFLKKIIDQIEYLDTQPPGAQISLYQDVLKLVKEWDGTYDSKLVFQSDLCKPAVEMQVSASVLNEMQKAISFLALLNEAPVYTNLNKFKEEFSKRYENAEVSMLEVLDTESGVGYPTGIHANGDRAPLLNGLHFPIVSSAIEYKVRPWQKVLMKEYQECIAKGKIELVVTDALFAIDKKKIDASKLADSLYTICSLLGTSEELRTNDFSIDYKGSSGPSAANLLGRFCYLDSEIQSITEKLIQQEEQLQPDKIFAEIVHLAQSRVGNVLIRPAFRKYEIPILTIASVDVEHTIELSDILISLRNNKIVLRSKKFGKEILPRNSTAHNYSNDTVPYYYFLCDLQQQDSAVRLNWDWGLLNEFKFLPRIKYGRVILSKARWTLEEKDLSVSAKQSESEFRDKINSYRKDNNLPQWVILAQGDNQLPLDLEDTLSLKIVRQELARNKKIILEECLFQESNLLVEGPEGKFTNEIIIPWSKVKTTNDSRTVVKQEATVQRDFMPGTSWHYLKIYCGVKTGDQILSEIIKPLADELIKENTISQWFFIRYSDPDNHLRLRFKGEGTFFAKVTQRLTEHLQFYLSSNLVWRSQVDTYKREIERYGSENIENSEMLFYIDSTATVNILSLLEGDEGDDLLWQFALKGVDDLLDCFGFGKQEKIEFAALLSHSFKKEFNVDNPESRKLLGSKYREVRSKVNLALQDELPAEHEYHEVWKIFNDRKKKLAPCVDHINLLEITNKLSVPKADLLASYIHMFLNRFFRSKQRLQEMIIYDLLHQHYKSQLGREKQVTKITQIEPVS